jgi:hypothetical protein
MPKERTDFIVKRKGNLYARISYTDKTGKRRELMRRVEDRSHARELLKQLAAEITEPESIRE